MDIHEIIGTQERGELLTVDDLADAIEAIFNAIDDFIDLLEQEAHMGAFDVVNDITIPDPTGGEASEAFRKKHGKDATAEQEFRAKWNWEAHEQVIVRGTYTGVQQEEVDNASTVFNRSGKKASMDVRMGTARNKLLEVMILDWTLSQRGVKVPVTPQNIAHLPANYRTPILERIDEIARVMSEEEQEDFLLSANGHSEGTLELMSPSLNPS